MTRSALIVAHTGRKRIVDQARAAGLQLLDADFEVRMEKREAIDAGLADRVRIVDGPDCAVGAEIALVLGGDGTFLRAAELTRPARVPLIGVNLGHVGFLAEAEPEDLGSAVEAIIACKYRVEQRLTLDIEVVVQGEVVARQWALNEASIEKSARERMLELALSVDDVPVLRFGCDGIMCATPTGSTAYAFSVGGPIVWPDVEAMLVVPNAAHALFARPLVVAPDAVISIELLRHNHPGILSCDGRRSEPLPPASHVLVRRSELPMLIARLHRGGFASRLVDKFELPVKGFRDGRGLII